jgi:hypothetical protein
VPPSVFEPIVRNLRRADSAPRTRTPEDRLWTRIVVDKVRLESRECADVNNLVLGLFAEHQT